MTVNQARAAFFCGRYRISSCQRAANLYNGRMKDRKPLQKLSKGLIGAVAMAGGSSAYGDVVVVAPPRNLISISATEDSVFFDFNLDGIDDVEFTFRQPDTTGGLEFQGNLFASPGNFTFGTPATLIPGGFYAHRFSLGDTISGVPPSNPPGTVLVAGPAQAVLASRFNGTTYGEFAPPNSRGFVGIQFTDGANDMFFGYIELQITRSADGSDPGIEFFSAAYDNTPGTSIAAGAIPEPGTLALLAFGGAGVLAAHLRRRRRQKEAK